MRLPGKAAFEVRAFNPNILALISLELLLLAFFLLLASLGDFEERRVEGVVQSLEARFAGRSPSEARRGAPEAAATGETHPAERLRQLLEGSLPLERLEVTRSGRVIEVGLESEGLFDAEGKLGEGAGLLLDRLALFLKAPELARESEVALLLGAAEREGVGLSSPLFSRAGRLAAALAERGVPPERIAVGLLPARPGHLRIDLRLPRLDPLPGRSR